MTDAVTLAKAIRDTYAIREASYTRIEGRSFGRYSKSYDAAYDETGAPAIYKGLVVAALQSGYCDFHDWSDIVLKDAWQQV